MPWPDETVRSFQKVPIINPSEADFNGPYNELLSMLFPWDTDYTVTWYHMPNSLAASNFILLYEVPLEVKLVFVPVLNPSQDLRYDSTRQIRRQDPRG